MFNLKLFLSRFFFSSLRFMYVHGYLLAEVLLIESPDKQRDELLRLFVGRMSLAPFAELTHLQSFL